MTQPFREIQKERICPCGSGLSYGSCCRPRGIKWGTNAEGSLVKQIKLSDDTAEMLEEHLKQLEQDLGRPLQDDDLLFPELAAMDEDELTATIIKHLTGAGIDTAFIYAFQQTGLLITEENQERVPNADRSLWDQAVADYRAMQN